MLRVDAAAAAGGVVQVHEDVPSIQPCAAAPVEGELRPLAGNHLRRLQLVREQFDRIPERGADRGGVGRGRNQDVTERVAVHLRVLLRRLRLLEGALDTGGADQGGSGRPPEARIVPPPRAFRPPGGPPGGFAGPGEGRRPAPPRLFALGGRAAAPPLLEPLSIVDAANAVARLLFY